MGTACESAEPRDLIFQVPNNDLAMVIRNLGTQWTVVGYAGIAMSAERWKASRGQNKMARPYSMSRAPIE
jgi:hypothetical protein